tara:strand:- start:462 stop:761 length:300 start_codon:yes stop_codon:yes gene_type:complete
MSEKKERRRKKATREEPEDVPIQQTDPDPNMIQFNPTTDVIIKLGQLVSIKNLLAQIIDSHPECSWTSDEVLRLGTWMEEFNKYVRENAIEVENNENID